MPQATFTLPDVGHKIGIQGLASIGASLPPRCGVPAAHGTAASRCHEHAAL
jgi:hypothetical protein